MKIFSKLSSKEKKEISIFLFFRLIFIFCPQSVSILSGAEKSFSDCLSSEEMTVVSSHQILVNGKPLKYKARTGFLPICDQFGEIKARFFYMAYTLEETKSSTRRPLTFAWQGGPGASSSLLHLGLLGPRRAKTLSEYSSPPPPFEIVDNEQTWLNFTDLVLVDPVGTGYSYPLKPEYGNLFWGVKQDIDSITEFIRIYLTHYDALNVPIFLVGESYGTFRAAGVAEKLLQKGFCVEGVILISCVLDMREKGDLSFVFTLPSLTASAFFHKKLEPELQKDFLKAVQQAEEWAENEFIVALIKGDRLRREEREAAIKKMARFTGLSLEFIEKNNLRIGKEQFSQKLLEAEKKFLGHYDARVTGESEGGAYDPTKDPSLKSNGISELIVPYLRSELGFKIDSFYKGPFGGFWPPSSAPRGDWMAYRWEWGSILDPKLDMSPELASAMRKKPDLRVFVASGYYDLATPYFATESTLSRMGLSPELRANVIHKVYHGGHMMYFDNDVRIELTRDAASFFKAALEKEERK